MSALCGIKQIDENPFIQDCRSLPQPDAHALVDAVGTENMGGTILIEWIAP